MESCVWTLDWYKIGDFESWLRTA